MGTPAKTESSLIQDAEIGNLGKAGTRSLRPAQITIRAQVLASVNLLM